MSRSYLEIGAADVAGARGRVPLGYLECLMLWPDKPQEQRDAMRATEIEAALEIMAAIDMTLPINLVKEIRNAPPLPNFDRDVKLRFLHGFVVGWILDGMLADASLQLKQAIGAVAAKFPTEKVGISPFSDRNILTNVWPSFRPVAHLWAACAVGKQWQRDHVFPCSLRDLPSLLSVGEMFRRAGEKRALGRARLLDPSLTLCVRPEINLPVFDLQFVESSSFRQ